MYIVAIYLILRFWMKTEFCNDAADRILFVAGLMHGEIIAYFSMSFDQLVTFVVNVDVQKVFDYGVKINTLTLCYYVLNANIYMSIYMLVGVIGLHIFGKRWISYSIRSIKNSLVVLQSQIELGIVLLKENKESSRILELLYRIMDG